LETALSPFHVLIIGGGIGGLCLAQGLKKSDISVAVYERDQSAQFRNQRYRISIKEEGGQALRDCLPENLLQALLGDCHQNGYEARCSGPMICFTSTSARIASQTIFELSFQLRPLLDSAPRLSEGNTADESYLSRPDISVGKVGRCAATIWLLHDRASARDTTRLLRVGVVCA
jgi:monoamine oxidase